MSFLFMSNLALNLSKSSELEILSGGLQDTFAASLPAAVIAHQVNCSADVLCVDFYRGVKFTGTFKLPLATLRQASSEVCQVLTSSRTVET